LKEQQASPETAVETVEQQLPRYEKPRITVMEEADVLKAFQFTSAGISWWVM
jgi:hypothetical protein